MLSSEDLSYPEIIFQKIKAIDLIVALASRHNLQTRKPRLFIRIHEVAPATICSTSSASYNMHENPVHYLHRQRTRRFDRIANMWDHVERVHIPDQAPNDTFICYHLICKSEGLVLTSIRYFNSRVVNFVRVKLHP